MIMKIGRCLLALLIGSALSAQVYSPKLLAAGQPDSTDLAKFVQAICAQAHAVTPREKAEAIWRFFLTDGRYVKPGFWYHIAGWAYEEPSGEVLDPIKLLNSYGFGLCYHIAPLLQAAFLAGGFEDARTWFLTGHTVTEVFYDGAYHYFDSDMMGYNVAGAGSFRGKPVASVRDIERDPSILLGKLERPDHVKEGTVPYPWYPADVAAKAIGGLASLFTTTNDNYLYPFTRYSPGHTMDFVLRKGETLTRFFRPEEARLYYLPYKFDGNTWSEFPQAVPEYDVRTENGPRSQKDERTWGTGRIEYTPRELPAAAVTVIAMPSPYVIIDARFRMAAHLNSSADTLRLATSIDRGQTWTPAAGLTGPYDGVWTAEPKVLLTTAHGRLTAVSGTYGYDLRITKTGTAGIAGGSLHLLSRIELNPRSLPSLQPGLNRFVYTAGAAIERIVIPAPLAQAPATGLAYAAEHGQGFLHPLPDASGEVTYVLEAAGRSLVGFDAGARFLDLGNGLAPDKLTAETRGTSLRTGQGDAAISWSASPDGPFRKLWGYPRKLEWRDGEPIDRLLLWPETLVQVRDLPSGTKRVYLRFTTAGPAIDGIRLAVYAPCPAPAGTLEITQVWRENGARRQHVERLAAEAPRSAYTVRTGPNVQNEAVIFAVQ